MKYTSGEFKADAVTGVLNGLTFGMIYSFYTHPFQFSKPQVKEKYKGKKLFYYRSWTGRMGLAFCILRTSYNAISKQQWGPVYELSAMAGVTLTVSQFLF